jgi:hypothetical protein
MVLRFAGFGGTHVLVEDVVKGRGVAVVNDLVK